MKLSMTSRAFAAWVVLGLLFRVPVEAAAILVAGGCTLPNAITAAETNSVMGSCSAGSGADVIHLSEDVLLTSVGPVGGRTAALPLITTPITIRGNGFSIRMGSGVSGSMFIIDATGDLTLTSILIEDSSQVAIHNSGTLRIRRSTLRNNAQAIWSNVTSAVVDISDSSLINNTAISSGGAIHSTGTLTVERSTFSGNQVLLPAGSLGGGGAIFTARLTTVVDSLFEDNSVEGNAIVWGGAILVEGGPTSVLLERSTFARNSVSGATARGGGVHVKRETTIINSTFTENTAVGTDTGAGGGLSIRAPSIFSVEVTNSTFVNNSREPAPGAQGNQIHAEDLLPLAPVTIKNVVATGASPGCAGTMTDGGGNFDCLSGPTVTGLDPSLSDNGGATPTHALLPGSNAIDAGGMSCSTLTDQRWVNRSGNCDSGAFELGGCPDDRHEVEGPAGIGDDVCFGAPIDRSGVAQSHRMCNQDWIFFGANLGANYSIVTSNLGGGADTIITTASGCGGSFPVLLDTDDNSGGGLASRLDLGGIGDFIGVRVRDTTGVYNFSKSYDITVTCTSGFCPCSSPDGLDLVLTSSAVTTPRAYEVCEELSAGGTLTVHAAGALLLSAGEKVALTNGFTVLDGGRLIVVQDSDLKPAL